jgi:predicted nucleic acid-binding protein
MAYWDTSALAKLYVAEADSPYFLRLIAKSDEAVVSSVIAAAEMLCVLYRKEHAQALKLGAAKHVYRKFQADVNAGRILTVPFGHDAEGEAEKLARLGFAQPKPVLTRSLDLIHVSTALSAKATIFVAADVRLREAADLAGLNLLP